MIRCENCGKDVGVCKIGTEPCCDKCVCRLSERDRTMVRAAEVLRDVLIVTRDSLPPAKPDEREKRESMPVRAAKKTVDVGRIALALLGALTVIAEVIANDQSVLLAIVRAFRE